MARREIFVEGLLDAGGVAALDQRAGDVRAAHRALAELAHPLPGDVEARRAQPLDHSLATPHARVAQQAQIRLEGGLLTHGVVAEHMRVARVARQVVLTSMPGMTVTPSARPPRWPRPGRPSCRGRSGRSRAGPPRAPGPPGRPGGRGRRRPSSACAGRGAVALVARRQRRRAAICLLGSLGIVHRAGLAHDADLDLAGIVHVLLDLAGDVAGKLGCADLVHFLRLDDDAHLAPRLDGE